MWKSNINKKSNQPTEYPTEYWTKERMEEAEPQPMPTVKK